MNLRLEVTRIAVARIVVFSADVLLLLILLSLPFIWAVSAIHIRPPQLAYLLLEYYEDYIYMIPVLGLAWLYNRFQSRRFVLEQLVLLPLDVLKSTILSSLAIGLGVACTILVIIDNSLLAGIGLFFGVMLASGAGAALKHRAIGRINERTQLVAALLSALAILVGSWSGSWAIIAAYGVVIPGGYLAPLLGICAGLFMAIEDGDRATVAQTGA